MTSTELSVAADVALLRVLIVDDHRTLAELLAYSLQAEHDIDVVGHATHAAQCLELVEQLRPDVILMDYSMPEVNGIDLTRAVRAQYPLIRVVMLTGATDPQLIVRAAQAGVCAFLPKSGELADVLTAVRSVSTGGMNVPTGLIAALAASSAPKQAACRLTARERDVLEMLARGRDARRAARELGISLNTCRGYVKAVLHKLGAHSQLEAVAIARRLNLLGSGLEG